jgi:hypothetical protein
MKHCPEATGQNNWQDTKMQRLFGLLLVACVIAGLSSCASKSSNSKSQSPLAAARQQLVADLGQCTQTFGYDPNSVTGVAENQLAPHELQWRQCGYDAVRKYARSHPALTAQYEQLINEDITMTNAIQAGAMTRSQRRQRIEALIAQIKSAEESQVQAAATEQAEETERVRQMVDGMRGFY